MKKSEIYKTAQMAVLHYPHVRQEDVLIILRELMEKENTALYIERKAVEENLVSCSEEDDF